MKRIITPILTALALAAPLTAPFIINPPVAQAQAQDQSIDVLRQSFIKPIPENVGYADFTNIYKHKFKDQYGTMLDSRHLYDTMRSPEYSQRAEKAWDKAMANRPDFLDDMLEKNTYIGRFGQALAYADEQGNIVMLIPETAPGNGYIAYNNAEPKAPLQEGPGPQGRPQGDGTHNSADNPSANNSNRDDNNPDNAPEENHSNDSRQSAEGNNSSTEDGDTGFGTFTPNGDEDNKDSQSDNPSVTSGEGSQFDVDENGNPINTSDDKDAKDSDADKSMSTSTIIGLVVSLLILIGVGTYVFMNRRKSNTSDNEDTTELPANWNDE